MKKEDIMVKLQEIFADVFGNDNLSINEETNADDIDAWDSLTNITILAAVQDEFSVSFEIDEIVAMKNVGEMIAAIAEKIK
ncbi:acyl carrier protein [Eubacterium ruminantium]|uniref:Acyl carrier protein n=1 Tax=Eubacterium ruminantium TaxID=42322 RepID=A0A1T4K749_9FIRM|nr:acyl carrier protein [Eubacterium ruminantium]SCW27251.1 acyl carrier protein [Eubacterium ruminantium]SDM15577.1 acyl carrier protein [Eubacterium ruminantium]SJZ38157.1 acyl carrier protein [Eubacterium ruminantium]